MTQQNEQNSQQPTNNFSQTQPTGTGPTPQQGGYPSPPAMPPCGWGPPPGYPPNMRPPGSFPPGFPPPRRRGWGRWIFVAILIVLLGASILVNVLLFSSEIVGISNSNVQTSITSPGDSHQQIAVLPIEGMIDETMEARFERFIDRAKDDTDVKAVVLLIDTPGGTVTASDEIYSRIKKFKSDRNVPVVVAMRGMATSGGYYAACAGDYIFAERTTLTGNIGVLMPRYNFSKLMEKYGIEDDTTVSTNAIYKDAGSPTRASNDRDNAYFQREIDGAFKIFKNVVNDGRTGRLKKPIDEIANGMAYSGNEALELGLIDEIDAGGYLDSAVAYAAKQANLSKPQVVQYHDTPPSLLNLLARTNYAGGRANVSGVTINLDAGAIDRLSSGRMMYLYRGAGAAGLEH